MSKEIRLSNTGEGFFEFLLSSYAILHQVNRSNDIGIDYFGEWINKKESSNVLFAIQLKTTQEKNINLKKVGNNSRLNSLDQYEIKRKKGGNFDNSSIIKRRTLEYWKGFEIPVYLFIVLLGKAGNRLFYKRYTPILHGKLRRNEEKFHLANNKEIFLAYIGNKQGGFCRDLFVDYIRCNYKKGALIHKKAEELNLLFNEGPIYKDMMEEYAEEINETKAAFRIVELLK